MIVLLHEGPSPYQTVEFVPENSDDAECLDTFLKQIEDKIRFKPKEKSKGWKEDYRPEDIRGSFPQRNGFGQDIE